MFAATQIQQSSGRRRGHSAFTTPPPNTLHRDDPNREFVDDLLIREAVVRPEEDVRTLSLQA